MPRIPRPTKPLADVNLIRQPDGRWEVVVCFMPDPETLVVQGQSKAVLAIDASSSIRPMFGGKQVFQTEPNVIQAVARRIGGLLGTITNSKTVGMMYWALGPAGDQVEWLGEFPADACAAVEIVGPSKQNWGRGTRLMPTLRHIVDTVASEAEFTIGVVLTDGVLDDIDEVRTYSHKIGEEIVFGKRKSIKLILIGIGNEIDAGQLESLNDLFETSPLKGKVDLWATGVASDMRDEADVIGALFGELMSESDVVAPAGSILSGGRIVQTYTEGLPGKIRFELLADATEFTLRVPGYPDVVQELPK